MLRRGPCVHACRAGEDVFHTRGDRRREGAPRQPVRGDRRRAVLDSFKQLQIDFQAKRICIRKTVLRAIWVSCGMCSLNRWIIFLRAFLQKFQPINLRSWALYRLLFEGAADGVSSASRCSFWWALIHGGPKWFQSTFRAFQNVLNPCVLRQMPREMCYHYKLTKESRKGWRWGRTSHE